MMISRKKLHVMYAILSLRAPKTAFLSHREVFLENIGYKNRIIAYFLWKSEFVIENCTIFEINHMVWFLKIVYKLA